MKLKISCVDTFVLNSSATIPNILLWFSEASCLNQKGVHNIAMHGLTLLVVFQTMLLSAYLKRVQASTKASSDMDESCC